jgi:hypothetical protein
MEGMLFRNVIVVVILLASAPVVADDPWIIVDDVVISEPTVVGDVIVALNGSLTVTGVPDPGLQVEGNLWAIGSGEILFEDSVIQFMSAYHGQYALAVADLRNDTLYTDTQLDIGAHDLHLVNASIDTWNLYPQGEALVQVRDSHVGEILAIGAPRVFVHDTIIDGTGGFLGSRGQSVMRIFDSAITCTVEAAGDSTLELHHSSVEPYPADPTGEWTRFGAYDRARLYAHHTPVNTTPALGDDGLIAVSYILDPPTSPPTTGSPASLWGIAAQFSVNEAVQSGSWRIEAVPRASREPELIAEGQENVEEGDLGVWRDAEPERDYVLRVVFTDGLGRSLIGSYRVRGSRSGPRRARPVAAPSQR